MSTEMDFIKTFIEAYSQGAFLMGDEESFGFYTVNRRALMPIEGIHVSRSFARHLRKRMTTITFDQDLAEVMAACRENRDGQWILPEFIPLYLELQRQGYAHSCEAWREGRLIGGVYGIALGSCFFGESMFTREKEGGKEALWAMVHHCRSLGFTIFDSQFINEHTESLGAYEVDEKEFKQMLDKALTEKPKWSCQLAFDLETAIKTAR
jgi:leucyl/phenylalanyl-tRNA--protein transferase